VHLLASFLNRVPLGTPWRVNRQRPAKGRYSASHFLILAAIPVVSH